MSKSQGNAIPLSASADDIRATVRQMYTDPDHLRVADPGKVEGNVVFTYLDAFGEDTAMIEDLKVRYRQGGLGDTTVKRHLEDVLQALLAPIRERRARYAADPATVMDVLRRGTYEARDRTQATLDEVRDGLGLFKLGQDFDVKPCN
jgi:tryptophanyl-tRNA synthetase